jgi:pyruvate,orthophosphate dikinase
VFDGPLTPRLAKSHYEEEMEEAFPQDPAVQLAEVLQSMARAWEGTSARLLRQARARPADAGLGLVVQRMALGLGARACRARAWSSTSTRTPGRPQITGRYLSQGQGRAALTARRRCSSNTDAIRGAALEDDCPESSRR